MIVSAIVMSGANRFFTPSITEFAIVHYQAKDVGIIHTPNIDERFRATHHVRQLQQKRFALRENAEGAIQALRRTKGRQCDLVGILIVKVRRCCCSSDFHECLDFAFAERDEVAQWKLFPELHVACFMPDRTIMEVGL